MNIYEIAKQANVSTATVSRALNGGTVKESTREKIFEIIRQNNYTAAKRKKRDTTEYVLIMMYGSYTYLPEEIEFLQKKILVCGYNSIIYVSEYGSERFPYDLAEDEKLRGIFVISDSPDSDGRKYFCELARNIPVIAVGTHIKSANICSVVMNDYSAVEELVKKLFANGHKKFIFAYDPDSPSSQVKLRHFENGIAACRLKLSSFTELQCDNDIHRSKLVIKNALSRDREITAVIAASDEIAVGAVKAADESGLRVPEDISITGFGNSPLSLACRPELTTVDIKSAELFETAAAAMTLAIDKKLTENLIEISPEIIVRKSALV